MPRNKEIKKVLVIGSGPIVIGQAAEFDYAGTQACRSLKEEGLEVVLLNSNPATIMTDKDIADKVYIEPLTVEVVEQLIMKEKPDSVLPTLGGQAALNLAMELEERGFFKEHNVRLIGTTAQTIKKAEDRLEFKSTMEKIGEPCAASLVVESVEDGIEFAEKLSKAYSETCKPLCHELNIPQTAFDILLFLANNPEYKTARDIVEIRKIKANLVSVNVDKLVNEGYLERKSVEGDRRKVNLICTEKSKEIIQEGQKLQQSFVEKLFEGMDEDTRKALQKGMAHMEANIEKMLEEKN